MNGVGNGRDKFPRYMTDWMRGWAQMVIWYIVLIGLMFVAYVVTRIVIDWKDHIDKWFQ